LTRFPESTGNVGYPITHSAAFDTEGEGRAVVGGGLGTLGIVTRDLVAEHDDDAVFVDVEHCRRY
jgi:hypothetical protein